VEEDVGGVDMDVSSGLDLGLDVADVDVGAAVEEEDDEGHVPGVAVSDFLVPRRLLLFFVSRLMM
jgi:hypothetical protein